jgi:glycosyltransferase involved in cell wall biosynthesis
MTIDPSRLSGERQLSILTMTTLFPNAVKPAHGIFVETRLQKLVATGEVVARVIAPVPWLPSFINYPSAGPLHQVPRRIMRGGLNIEYPRYAVVPRVGMNVTPYTLYLSMRKALKQMLNAGQRFDLIDAHYFYPDGVAAVWLAREFGLPVVVTARGTDINLIPQYALPRRLIRQAADKADGLITVCKALKTRLVELGVKPERVTVLRNGVDLELFRPLDRGQLRQKFGMRRRTLGSVGHLIQRKGHHHVIAALPGLPDTDLVIVGEGPERSSLEKLAAARGVSDRVNFLGAVEQGHLPAIYSAIDALVLASNREGWANVLLEAMACGTPVVASPVWGTPEIVSSPEAGVLMPSLDSAGVVAGVAQLFGSLPSREATRQYAEGFGWAPTTLGQLQLFRAILARRQASG